MIDLATIAVFSGVAALLVVSPGPNGVLVAKTVPTSGRAAGIANVLGFLTAFYVHGALAILGLSLVLLRSAELFTLVKLAGATYLAWIGFKALREAFQGRVVRFDVEPARHKRTLAYAYLEGLLTNLLNPKVALFYIAAFPQFLPLDASPVDAFILVAIHSFLNLVWFGAMVVLLARLTGFMRGGAVQRWIKGVTGVLFLGFGVKLAATQP